MFFYCIYVWSWMMPHHTNLSYGYRVAIKYTQYFYILDERIRTVRSYALLQIVHTIYFYFWCYRNIIHWELLVCLHERRGAKWCGECFFWCFIVVEISYRYIMLEDRCDDSQWCSHDRLSYMQSIGNSGRATTALVARVVVQKDIADDFTSRRYNRRHFDIWSWHNHNGGGQYPA